MAAEPTAGERKLGVTLALAVLVAVVLLAVGGKMGWFDRLGLSKYGFPSQKESAEKHLVAPVEFEQQSVTLHPDLAKDFSTSEIQNVAAMEAAYGFTFTPQEFALLAQHKFLAKNLLDTSIRPKQPPVLSDRYREFTGLYNAIRGPFDYKERKAENAMFFSADVFLNHYSILLTELLKEAENEVFYPEIKTLSEKFYQEAEKRFAAAPSPAEKNTWTKVRNYLAIPYSIFSAVAAPLSTDDYFQDGTLQDPNQMAAEHDKQDAEVDTYDNVAAFVKGLKLEPGSEEAVLADIKKIYETEGPEMPAIFKDEYTQYANDSGIEFTVDFTQFTPRSHYTNSSLRRQYFRGMMWFNQLPFFLKSETLSDYAFAISDLFSAYPEQKQAYGRLDATISFLVGESDDLTPNDYLEAQQKGRGERSAALDYLAKTKEPRIKNLPAAYPTVGNLQTQDVVAATKGMRFFSGKFIIDSYWTGRLTQGDEAPRPGYTQKLPPMASSLQVMSLLGSEYAESQIPNLDFYAPNNSQAITQALAELQQEVKALDEEYWRQTAHGTGLWTIQGLFEWFQGNRQALPRFMQSPLWDVKTLMTASGFWTELRHATLLYAKQSFAELGGGGPEECDPRKVPDPSRTYIEPQPVAYDRLYYLARKTAAGLEAQGLELNNLDRLTTYYIPLLELVRTYTGKELANAQLQEQVVEHTDPDPEDPTRMCVSYSIEGESEWEKLRWEIVDLLEQSLPDPVEGAVLPAKDKRAALVADAHTGGDSANPRRILYEGTGVPRVIFVAVKDTNGPRLTVGFTYSHYEFTQLLGGPRLTDEEWQKNFYQGEDDYSAFEYTPVGTWPATPEWYASLLRGK